VALAGRVRGAPPAGDEPVCDLPADQCVPTVLREHPDTYLLPGVALDVEA
jgi:hypothetical protein